LESKAEIKDGRIVGWICKYCKQYNDALTNHCNVCYAYKPDWLTGQVQALVEINRGIFLKRLDNDLLKD
jgi:hypothetical protein